MSNNAAAMANPAAAQSRSSVAFGNAVTGTAYFFAGLAILISLWWLAIYVATLNPKLSHFASFGPVPAFKAIPHMWSSGLIPKALETSGYRLGMGLLLGGAAAVAAQWSASRLQSVSEAKLVWLLRLLCVLLALDATRRAVTLALS